MLALAIGVIGFDLSRELNSAQRGHLRLVSQMVMIRSALSDMVVESSQPYSYDRLDRSYRISSSAARELAEQSRSA